MSVDDFFSKLNPVMLAILGSPLHGLLSWGLMTLTVTGRRTGRRYSIPVGYQREADGRLSVLVSEAHRKTWWRNFLAARPVEVRLRGRQRHATAEVAQPGSDAFRTRIESTVRRVPGMDRVCGIRYDRRVGLDDEQMRHLATAVAVVEIRLDPA